MNIFKRRRVSSAVAEAHSPLSWDELRASAVNVDRLFFSKCDLGTNNPLSRLCVDEERHTSGVEGSVFRTVVSHTRFPEFSTLTSFYATHRASFGLISDKESGMDVVVSLAVASVFSTLGITPSPGYAVYLFHSAVDPLKFEEQMRSVSSHPETGVVLAVRCRRPKGHLLPALRGAGVSLDFFGFCSVEDGVVTGTFPMSTLVHVPVTVSGATGVSPEVATPVHPETPLTTEMIMEEDENSRLAGGNELLAEMREMNLVEVEPESMEASRNSLGSPERDIVSRKLRVMAKRDAMATLLFENVTSRSMDVLTNEVRLRLHVLCNLHAHLRREVVNGRPFAVYATSLGDLATNFIRPVLTLPWVAEDERALAPAGSKASRGLVPYHEPNYAVSLRFFAHFAGKHVPWIRRWTAVLEGQLFRARVNTGDLCLSDVILMLHHAESRFLYHTELVAQDDSVVSDDAVPPMFSRGELGDICACVISPEGAEYEAAVESLSKTVFFIEEKPYPLMALAGYQGLENERKVEFASVPAAVWSEVTLFGGPAPVEDPMFDHCVLVSEFHIRMLLFVMMDRALEMAYTCTVAAKMMDTDPLNYWWDSFRSEIVTVDHTRDGKPLHRWKRYPKPDDLGEDESWYNSESIVSRIRRVDRESKQRLEEKESVARLRRKLGVRNGDRMHLPLINHVGDMEDLMRYSPPCMHALQDKLRTEKHLRNKELIVVVPYLVRLGFDAAHITSYMWKHFSAEVDLPVEKRYRPRREKDLKKEVHKMAETAHGAWVRFKEEQGSMDTGSSRDTPLGVKHVAKEYAERRARPQGGGSIYIGYNCSGMAKYAPGIDNPEYRGKCPFAKKQFATETRATLLGILKEEGRGGDPAYEDEVDTLLGGCESDPVSACKSFFSLRYGGIGGTLAGDFGSNPQNYAESASRILNRPHIVIEADK